MEISLRLLKIVDMIKSCRSIVDVGTDHGYVPIYMVKHELCKFAIASDINKGPVEKARLNLRTYGLESKIQCRRGPGLSTIKKGEAEVAIIAGMGGNLIRDILLDDMDIVKSLNYMILQPVQNPEILRKFLYENGFEILDEELCYDEGKYYEYMKVRYGKFMDKPQEDIYFYISPVLLNKKHPLLKEYITYKRDKAKNVVFNLVENTENAANRKKELEIYISKLEEVLACL